MEVIYISGALKNGTSASLQQSSEQCSFSFAFGDSYILSDPQNVVTDAEAPGQKVPLPNVAGKILSKVIEFCSFHVNHVKDVSRPNANQTVKTDEEIKAWDADFMKVDQSTLFEIILVSCKL